MTQSVNIHASCVVLAGAGEAFSAPRDAGVLLLGDSGTGKSDLALRLIARGAVLVADDRCEIFVKGNALRSRAVQNLAGLIEVRGVGIVRLPFISEARVALVARLVAPQFVPRLPEPARYEPPPALSAPDAVRPPEIVLAPFEASACAKLAAAVAAHAGARSTNEVNTH